MSLDKGEDRSREKTRLCPACRMEISVLATKCRFCGEEVGRPKEEARQLNISDLGGGPREHYVASENVQDALEAFRAEEMSGAKPSAQDEPHGHRAHFKRRAKHEPEVVEEEEESPLDRVHKEPEGTIRISDSFIYRASEPSKRSSSGGNKILIVLVFVVAAVVLYFAGRFVKSKVDAYLAASRTTPQVVWNNEAPGILDSGGSPFDALAAAVEALRHVDDDANRKIADRVRQAVKAQVDALLEGESWEIGNLSKASELATRALQIDPDSTFLQQMSDEVTNEIFDYRMTIDRIDRTSNEVTLWVSRPEEEPVRTVFKEGDRFRGRFEIAGLGDSWVRIRDSKRKDALGQSRAFKLYKDGRIVAE